MMITDSDRSAVDAAVVADEGYCPGFASATSSSSRGKWAAPSTCSIVVEPKAQFEACFENLRTVLAEAGCTFDDIVDMTTYHVDMGGTGRRFAK